MPPTVAAARITASGHSRRIHASTCAWERRSQTERLAVRISQFSRSSRRTSADPTRPPCPATQIRLPDSANELDFRDILDPLYVRLLTIRLDHFRDQFRECRLVMPSELGSGFRRIAEQQVDLGRPVIARID